jgi:hypothetical protein
VLILLWIHNELSYDRFHEKQRPTRHGTRFVWWTIEMLEQHQIRHLNKKSFRRQKILRINGKMFSCLLSATSRSKLAVPWLAWFLTMFSFPLERKRPALTILIRLLSHSWQRDYLAMKTRLAGLLRLITGSFYRYGCHGSAHNTDFDFEWLVPGNI